MVKPSRPSDRPPLRSDRRARHAVDPSPSPNRIHRQQPPASRNSAALVAGCSPPLITAPDGQKGSNPGLAAPCPRRPSPRAGRISCGLRGRKPEGRILILHTAGCWAPQGRLTPVTDADQVQVFLRETWARPCDVCAPELPASR
ncbi:DUF6233 domain-containing protein [Streptomyces griseoviridis]